MLKSRASTILTCSILMSAIFLCGCQMPEQKVSQQEQKESVPKEDPVKRGEYLVKIAACNDCHTPFKMGPNGPEPDMSKMLSGHPESLKMPPPPTLEAGPWGYVGSATNTAYAGPWGITYAPNLTPDQNTGMGIWTEEMFLKAIRTGKHFGTSRPIQPPMPWHSYSHMTDDDLEAMFNYLRSIPPISNRVPDYEPPVAP